MLIYANGFLKKSGFCDKMPEARVEPYIFVQNNELKKGSRQKPYVPFNAVFGSKKLSGSYLILVQDKVKPNAVRRRFMVAVERNDKKDWLLKNLLISIGKGQFLLDSTLDGQNSVALFGGNFTYGGGVWTSKQGFSENKYFSQSHNSQLFRKAAQEYMLADSDGWERLTQDLDLIRGLNQDTGFATRYNRGGLVQVINRDPRFSVNGNKVNYVNGYSSG